MALAAAALAWAASARAAGGEKYALLVGVHNYSEEKVLHPLAYAEPDVTELAQVLPDYAVAYGNRGAAYYHKRLFDRSIADFTRVITLQPKNAAMYRFRAEAYKAVGEADKAPADLQTADRLEK